MNKSQLTAIKIAKRVFSRLKICEGRRENEVAAEIKKQLAQFGSRPAFRIIVASGKRSALPHGFATSKVIRHGDLVIIDFGVLYKGFRSDFTRTFVVGKPTARQSKIIAVVREAQKRAIKSVKAGKRCLEIDHAARSYIEKAGFGKYFIHGTGHGIGKKTHQAPKISKKNRRKIDAGEVITIEPGIYIKGFGGVRIEDMVLVTPQGCKIL